MRSLLHICRFILVFCVGSISLSCGNRPKNYNSRVNLCEFISVLPPKDTHDVKFGGGKHGSYFVNISMRYSSRLRDAGSLTVWYYPKDIKNAKELIRNGWQRGSANAISNTAAKNIFKEMAGEIYVNGGNLYAGEASIYVKLSKANIHMTFLGPSNRIDSFWDCLESIQMKETDEKQ